MGREGRGTVAKDPVDTGANAGNQWLWLNKNQNMQQKWRRKKQRKRRNEHSARPRSELASAAVRCAVPKPAVGVPSLTHQHRTTEKYTGSTFSSVKIKSARPSGAYLQNDTKEQYDNKFKKTKQQNSKTWEHFKISSIFRLHAGTLTHAIKAQNLAP